MTDRPFTKSLPALLEERGWSLRELVRRTQREIGWGSHAGIGKFLSGETTLTPKLLESVAKVMRIDPRHFPEYRLMLARRELDPNAVGLAQALGTLGASPHLSQLSARPSRTSRLDRPGKQRR